MISPRWPRGVVARSAWAATLVVTALMAVAVVLLVLLLQRSLVAGLEQASAGKAEAVVSEIRDVGLTSGSAEGRAELDAAVTSIAGHDAVVQVLDADGTVLAAAPESARGAPLVTTTPAPGSTLVTEQPLDVWGQVEEYRLVVFCATADGQEFTVVVGRSLEPVESGLRTLLVLLAVGVPLLLLAVGLATAHFVGRSLRPVEAIRQAVASIGDRELAERVPVPATGDEVARLAVTMNEMLARLEGASTAQRRFVADASHELRSPVATLRTSAEVQLAHPGVGGDGALAATVLTEARRMQRLVDDLLLLARHDDASRPHPQRPPAEVDLDDLVLAEQRRLVALGGAAVDLSVEPVRVLGDAYELSQVVRNLTDNAARHARGRIGLRLRREGADAVLDVVDDGPGIPVDQRERVFDRFVRLEEGRERSAGGSGLGLAIVRALVEAHGGRVRVADDAPDRDADGGAVRDADGGAAGGASRRGGTVLRVVLPAARTVPDPAHDSDPGSGSGQGVGPGAQAGRGAPTMIPAPTRQTAAPSRS